MFSCSFAFESRKKTVAMGPIRKLEEIRDEAKIYLDPVLCYLSNVIGQETVEQIDLNLNRYFSLEQIRNSTTQFREIFLKIRSSLNSRTDRIVEEKLNFLWEKLSDHSNLALVFENLQVYQIFELFPVFVSDRCFEIVGKPNDSMRKTVEDLVKRFSCEFSSLEKRICPNSCDDPFSLDQCCLTSNCQHNSLVAGSNDQVDFSLSSSCSSIDFDRSSTENFQFVRNPVTNFLIRLDFDEPTENKLTRAFSCQPTNFRRNSFLVKRKEDFWIFPAASNRGKVQREISQKPFLSRAKSLNETFDRLELVQKSNKSRRGSKRKIRLEFSRKFFSDRKFSSKQNFTKVFASFQSKPKKRLGFRDESPTWINVRIKFFFMAPILTPIIR